MKIPGARTFLAKDGEEWVAFPVKANNIFAGETSRNLDLSIVDRADQYGNDGFVSIDLGKERRLAGEKGPIMGNWKNLDGAPSQGRNPMGGVDRTANEARKPAGQQIAQQEEEDDETIPF